MIGSDTKFKTSSILTDYKDYSRKKSNDFAWFKECAKYIDGISSSIYEEERLRRLRLNYDLANGRGDEILTDSSLIRSIPIDKQSLMVGSAPVRHYPIIHQIYAAMTGEQMRSNMKFTAVDSSGYSKSMREQERLRLTQEWIKANIVVPAQQQVMMETMMEAGVGDFNQLSPEDQQDLQSDMQSRLKFRLPEDINEYLAKDYKTPVETQVQRIVNFLERDLDVKFMTDENFKNVILAGSEIYRLFIRHGKADFELVNPIGFWSYSKKNSLFIDTHSIITYDQHVTDTDILHWHGTELLKKKGKIEDATKTNGITGFDAKDISMSSAFPGIIAHAPSLNTPEGQEYAKTLYTLFGGKSGDVNYKHYAWKGFRKLKKVTRDDGIFYVSDESYERNPKKDRKIEIELAPEVYQITRINHDTWVEAGQYPYQHRSKDPFVVKMPYTGSHYNNLFGNSNNVAPMDLGKPYQYRYNVHMHRVEQTERKDKGNVLLFNYDMIPKEVPLDSFMTLLKEEGIVLYRGEMGPAETQGIRGIDLSNSSEKADQVQFGEMIKADMSKAMGYNPSRLGLVDDRTAVSINRQNIVQSTIQTEPIYRMHHKVVENLMTNLVNLFRVAYKDNPRDMSFVLDDMSVAELEIDENLLDIADQSVFVSNSIEDQRKLDEAIMLAQPLINSGQMDYPDAIETIGARNLADLMNITARSKRKRDEQIQQQQQMEQENIQLQAQMQQDLDRMKFEMELQRDQFKGEIQKTVALIASSDRAQANDVNKSGLNDAYEQKLMELQAEKERLEKELAFKEKELRVKDAREREKIRVQRIAAMRKPRSGT